MKPNFYKEAKDIWPMLETEDYEFLKELNKTNPLLFITLSGSRGYGTCKDLINADYDFRGVMSSSKSDLLGFGNTEQYIAHDVDSGVDATIYTINKLIKLLINCNPNTIELLGCKDYLIYHPLAIELINKNKMFLSQRAIGSFGGYATQQFDRLENNLARFVLNQKKKEKHILHSVKSCMSTIGDRYSSTKNQQMKLYIDTSNREELESEIFIDLNFKHYPLRDFSGIISEFNSVLRDYNKINHRNRKKDDEHLNKHAMHLIRLYYTLYDILTKEEIITYREDEIPILLSIRNGDFMLPDGTYRKEFFELLDDLKRKCKEAEKNTSLPKEPNMKEIEDFTIYLNEEMLNTIYLNEEMSKMM